MGKKDKHTKIVIKFVWLGDYIGKTLLMNNQSFYCTTWQPTHKI